MRRADGRRTPSGVALLEVLVAFVILGVAGLGMISLAIDAGRAVRRADASEAEIRRASEFLTRVALWDRVDLDRHLGAHRQGDWQLDISRPTLTLYALTLRDSTGKHPLLATTVYRGLTGPAAP